MVQSSGNLRTGDRESIWSVPGHLWRWYVGIFILQYFTFLGLTIWDEVERLGGGGAIEVTLDIQRGMTGTILNMAASTYIMLEVVMLAQWLRERDQRKREERLKSLREEVEEPWKAWYERMQAAQREGHPFNEPPPGGEKDTERK